MGDTGEILDFRSPTSRRRHRTSTAAANRAARSLIEHNKGEAISTFDDPFWRRYYHDRKGWLQDLIDGSRDMAKALDSYADAVHGAEKKLEHELEIVGATIVAGTALAVFTAGISEGAAVAATATITELAATLGVAVTEEIATIAATTLTTAALAGIESVTVDLAVTQPVAMATGEQTGGLNLDEAQEAGLYGGLWAEPWAVRERRFAVHAMPAAGRNCWAASACRPSAPTWPCPAA